MEKLAEKINLVIVSLLLLLASVIFFASVIGGQVVIGILAGCLTWIGSRIIKITIDESRN